MGTITTGIGLISGINTAQLIDSLISIESRGKAKLQLRAETLQAQRTALMDINARLLNLKNAAKGFRLNKIFQSTLATSSDEDVLTAIASKNAQPGTYQFIVKQLVSTSQQLTKGYATKTGTPLGLTALSFEFGRGNLANDQNLEPLNGGEGVDRGRIKITDRSGAEATIDLTDVTTLNEVLERINAASGIRVDATVSGDHLVLTDTSGGLGSITVTDIDGNTTAADLGILGSIAGNTLTGTIINTIGGATALSALNDGNGVLTQNNVTDLAITARDGTAINVELGRVDTPISGSTLLADLNNGTGVKIGTESNEDLTFVARDGTTHEVNLTGVTTVSQLISRVNTETGGKIAISVNADGERLTVTDTTGGTGTLKVLGAGVNATETAEDLGILNVTGVAAASFDGSIIPNTITTAPASTLDDVITRINNATGNGGKVVATIAGDGVSLLITDTTGGGGNLKVLSTTGNPYAAAALGIETVAAGVAASTIDGSRLIATLGSVLVGNLNGGDGLNGTTTLNLTDRNGDNVSITNLNTYDSLAQLIAGVNAQADAANVDIELSLNNAGNGLQVTDSSGGVSNLIVAGDAASVLGIDGNVAATSIRGDNLQHQYVSESSFLSDLNYGRGVGIGKFSITDSLGETQTVDIGSDAMTLYDVIAEINSRGLAINARINDNGDGLVIESVLGPGDTAVNPIKITAVSGSTAKDLNIAGTASTIVDSKIDGSYERTVALAETDTLAKVVSKINAANIPVAASIISAGSGATPYRLNFTSTISGRDGELVIDSGAVDLSLTTLSKGQDAKVFFGSDNAEDGFLITSSTNTINSAVDGVTITLKQTSEDSVTLTVNRDNEAIVAAVTQLVTTFNDAVGRIDQYDFFNVDTKKKGVLLGNGTTSRVREAMFRTLQRKAEGVDTQFQYLFQVGIKIGADGQVQFDQDKFNTAYADDPEAVENLFATFESTAPEPEEIMPGIFVTNNDANVTARGFGDLFDTLLESLTNKIDGVVTRADTNFQDLIELTNKRISDFDQRLDAKRARLQSQFNAMEAALAKLQGQTGSLSQLANSVALAQSA